MKIPKTFIGWTNIKKFIRELIATMSDEPSYFSKKRVQGWMLFLSAWISALVWFIYHFKTMDIGTLLAYIGTLFAYAGFQVVQTQREKKFIHKNKDENTT